jgi:hypothetical protein
MYSLQKLRINGNKIDFFFKKILLARAPLASSKTQGRKISSLKETKQSMAIYDVIPWGFDAISDKLPSNCFS